MRSSVTAVSVTGSSGFVGRHFVSWLASRGYQVIAVSRSTVEQLPVRVQAKRVREYTDEAALVSAFEGTQAVVHLAGRAHVLGYESRQDALRAFDLANVSAALASAEAALQAGCSRFVLVSSIGVNGQATHGQPFTEDSEPSPQEPYAISKLKAELALAARFTDTNLEWTVVRPPLVYGPGCPGNFQTLLSIVKRVPVLPFGALRARRSYIGIVNLCSALEMATIHPACAGRHFLLSDNEDVELAKLISFLAEGMGRANIPKLSIPPFALHLLAQASGNRLAFAKMCNELLVNSRAFAQCTGWQPPLSLSEGLAITANAYRESAWP